MVQYFRLARHTQSINDIKRFYVDILDFEEIGSFEGHRGYDGVMLGFKDHTWHMEFTQSNDSHLERKLDDDDLIVLYYNNERSYKETINKLEKSGVKSVKSKNPYWDENGKTFIDPEGWRVVICNRAW